MKPVLQLSRVLRVVFDDDKSVPFAGLLIPLKVADGFKISEVINSLVSGCDRKKRRNSGGKALNLMAMLLAGGDFLSDVNLLRGGATLERLGFRVFSESRLGEWLRSLNDTDIDGFKDALTETTETAWQAGFGPDLSGSSESYPLVVDIDSTFTETHGVNKEQARQRNYLGKYGYHPLLAVEASTGQIIGAELRAGNTADSKDAARFTNHALGRMRRLVGDETSLCLRADSGFYTWDLLDACRQHNTYFSVTVRQYKPIRDIINSIEDDKWKLVEKTKTEQTYIAEANYQTKGRNNQKNPIKCRLIIKRTTTPSDTGEAQPRLFNLHEYHAFVTDQPGNPAVLWRRHNQRATIETVIRDLKYNLGLNHYPSGTFTANAAWLQINTLTWNLAQYTIRLLTDQPLTLKTLRYRYLTIPGRITTGSRTTTLHYPTRWPWQPDITNAITTLNAA